jgi:hypothetical protein
VPPVGLGGAAGAAAFLAAYAAVVAVTVGISTVTQRAIEASGVRWGETWLRRSQARVIA